MGNKKDARRARRARRGQGLSDPRVSHAALWGEPLVRALLLLACGHTPEAAAEAVGGPLDGVQYLSDWATEAARRDFPPPAGLVGGMAAAYHLRPDRTSPIALTAIQLAGRMTEEQITARYEAVGLVAGPAARLPSSFPACARS